MATTASAKNKRPAKLDKDDVSSTKMSVGVVERHVAFGTNILEINVPPELDMNIPSNIGFMDDLTGGGWVPSSVCLLTGMPGAGKTTLALQLADAMHTIDNGGDTVAIYLGCEEAAVQMRKTVRRLSLTKGFIVDDCDLIDRCPSWKSDARRSVMDHLRTLREKYGKLVDAVDEQGRKFKKYEGKRFVIICDSLQSHDDGQYYNGHTNTRTQVRVAEQLASLAKSPEWGYPVIILIGQVNKGGDFAGPQQLKHAIDMHLELVIDMKKDSPTRGKRLLQFTKNRFGITGHVYVINVTSKGLVEEGTLQDFGD